MSKVRLIFNKYWMIFHYVRKQLGMKMFTDFVLALIIENNHHTIHKYLSRPPLARMWKDWISLTFIMTSRWAICIMGIHSGHSVHLSNQGVLLDYRRMPKQVNKITLAFHDFIYQALAKFCVGEWLVLSAPCPNKTKVQNKGETTITNSHRLQITYEWSFLFIHHPCGFVIQGHNNK